MNDRTQSNIASALAVIAGGSLLVTPLVTSVTGDALTNMLIVGGAIVLAGLVQFFWENTLPSWLTGLAGAWAFASAFVFDMSTAASWTIAVAGAVAFALALWDGVEVNHVRHEHHYQV